MASGSPSGAPRTSNPTGISREQRRAARNTRTGMLICVVPIAVRHPGRSRSSAALRHLAGAKWGPSGTILMSPDRARLSCSPLARPLIVKVDSGQHLQRLRAHCIHKYIYIGPPVRWGFTVSQRDDVLASLSSTPRSFFARFLSRALMVISISKKAPPTRVLSKQTNDRKNQLPGFPGRVEPFSAQKGWKRVNRRLSART